MSGNVKGRPKGSKNVATLFTEAANGQVSAVIDGKSRKIPKIQAAILQLVTKAAGGDSKYVTQLIDRMEELERRAAASRPADFPMCDQDLQVIRAVYERMKLCAPPPAEE